MKITKIGHCCLLIETKGKRFLTDPGMFTTSQNTLSNIDAVIITHEHADHFHVDSLKLVVKNNPEIKVVTNSAVGQLLQKEGISHDVLEGVAKSEFHGVSLCACDAKHAEIFEEFGQVQNTGYLIDGRLFYPGDAYALPGVSVEILALPVAGPWCKVVDVVNYARKIAPKFAFPVHDGQLVPDRVGGNYRVPELFLKEKGIEFIPLKEGESKEFAPR